MAQQQSEAGSGRQHGNACCSFCRKSPRDVGPLVEGPNHVYICGECIELCQSIIEQEKRRRGLDAGPAITSEHVETKLARFLHGQEKAVKALALAGQLHAQRLARQEDTPGGPMNAIVLVGPTRSGRLFAARCLAHVLGVAFVTINQNTLAEAASAEPPSESNLAHLLLAAAEFDAEAAQRGVVYVDGVDQPGLAQLLLERLAQMACNGLAQQFNLDISRPLFLLGGAFEGLERVMGLPEQPVSTTDLCACGIPPDLAARVRGVVRVAPLDEETMARVLSCAELAHWPQGDSSKPK